VLVSSFFHTIFSLHHYACLLLSPFSPVSPQDIRPLFSIPASSISLPSAFSVSGLVPSFPSYLSLSQPPFSLHHRLSLSVLSPLTVLLSASHLSPLLSILSHSSPHHHRPFLISSLIVPPNHRETTTFTNMHRQMQSLAAPFSVLTPTTPLHLLSILPSPPAYSPPLTPFLLSPLFRHSLLPSPLHPAALPSPSCLSHSPSPSSPSPLLRGVFCATTCSR